MELNNCNEMLQIAERLRHLAMSESDQNRLYLFTAAAKLEYGVAGKPLPPLPPLIRPTWAGN
ncbi:hypothetical protein M2352_001299 [Azospirillum fermentarium]|uniref:hypothetical protein n=1 Tax=Azospirillum fermentarium TaxID=1233114 RepID=UPI002227A176|nr:hypothetical protein [Azospirillum fermentarium]MCW2245708.1 hypothetical protein [Azospirillum fermentarium]